MIDINKQLQSISEAYLDILTEGKEPKFKAGDKVGIGSFSGYGYHPHDTGVVSSVGKNGRHAVTFDNSKIDIGAGIAPKTEVFDHAGISTKDYSKAVIIPHADHVKHAVDSKDISDRNEAMNHILNHISNGRTGSGNFAKLDRPHAEHLKSLIDKHTA